MPKIERDGVSRVRFLADDGREMFEVGWSRDGKSIEVRAILSTKHGDVIHGTQLQVSPIASNAVNIATAVVS